MKKYYDIRGKEIYTEVLGKDENKALLFIHGGPGGIGCEDFIKYQGGRLAENFKVVAVDQRGVWRSEEMHDDEKITLEDIIEDFEELRKRLHIEKWSLLCHSFGGYLSVLYADLYPDSIESIIYENPSFDFSLSERSMLENVSMELIRSGRRQTGQIYLKLMYRTSDYKQINKLLLKSLSTIGPRGNNIMWHSTDRNIVQDIAMARENAKNLIIKSNKTRFKLLDDWRVYHDVFEKLSRINKPCLLIKGKYDPITSKKQIKEFLFNVAENVHCERKVVRFDKSGHYARIEEPDRYCQVVTDFIHSLK